jgi:sigma-B regulation protein RsbU (phosphoserine phosphatase)
MTRVPGDRLLLYSDGVTEAMNAGSVEFGAARAAEILAAPANASPVAIRDAVLSALRLHTRECPPSDDVTLIAGVVQ